MGIGKRVLCLYRADASISKMITGNTSPNLNVLTYQNMQEIPALIDEFLGNASTRVR